MEWLANNESSLSAIAAIIAIVAGVAVVARLFWARIPGVKRPAFLSGWRMIVLIGLATGALLVLLLLATDGPEPSSNVEVARLTQVTGKPSVAVLPLNNLSDDPEQAYLADGIAEDIITLLSRSSNFFVIARNSSFSYRGQSPDIRTVGDELGVRYVVEGSLRKLGDHLRVTVQLIDSSNGQHIWANNYDRLYLDMFSLQNDIANDIAIALGDEIFRAEIARTGEVLPENLDTWGLLMKAQNAYIMYDDKSIATGEQLVREALALEPNYPLALVRLARLQAEKVNDIYGGDPEKDRTVANQLADKAIRLAPSDPLVMQSAGFTYSMTGRLDQSIHLLQRVNELDPYNAETLAWLSFAQTNKRENLPGALQLVEQAILLSPKSPFIYLFEFMRGYTLFELARYAEAEQAQRKSILHNRQYHWPWTGLAAAQAAQGNLEGARQSIGIVLKMYPQISPSDYQNALSFRPDNGSIIIDYIEAAWPVSNADDDKERAQQQSSENVWP